MSFLSDKYAVYVIAAYASTALILGVTIWATVAASRRARRELEAIERDRKP